MLKTLVGLLLPLLAAGNAAFAQDAAAPCPAEMTRKITSYGSYCEASKSPSQPAPGNGALAQNAAIRKQFAQRSREETLKQWEGGATGANGKAYAPIGYDITSGGADETVFVVHQTEISHEWCDNILRSQTFLAGLQSMGFTQLVCSYGNGNARFVFDLLVQQQPAPTQTQSQPTSTCRITPQDMDLAHKANDLATRIIDDLRVALANRGANMSDRRKVLQRILPQMTELRDINKQLISHSTILVGCPIETASEWVRLVTERANLMDEAMNEMNSYQTLIH